MRVLGSKGKCWKLIHTRKSTPPPHTRPSQLRRATPTLRAGSTAAPTPLTTQDRQYHPPRQRLLNTQRQIQQPHDATNYSPNAGVVDAAPNAGVAVAPKTPVDVPLPNTELPVCAPKPGLVLPNGLAPNGLLAWAVLPNGFGVAPNGLEAAGAPKGLGLDAPKAEHTPVIQTNCQIQPFSIPNRNSSTYTTPRSHRSLRTLCNYDHQAQTMARLQKCLHRRSSLQRDAAFGKFDPTLFVQQ